MRMNSEVSSEPKLNPDSVVLNEAVPAIFTSAMKLTTGAGLENSATSEIENTSAG